MRQVGSNGQEAGGGGVTRRNPASVATVFGWAIVISLMMSTEFLAQPFVWRNWPAVEVLAGWIGVAADRLMVACAVSAFVVAADRFGPARGRGRIFALGLAVLIGAVVGEALRFAANPFSWETDIPAVVGRILEWALISAAGIGILTTWRLGNDLATDAAAAAAVEARLSRMRTSFALDALQRQIEPHFLFNTLATVKRFSQSAPEDGRALVERLYDYVSTILDASRRTSSTLGEELDLARAYLDVCAVRMDSRLAVTIDFDPRLRDFRVPPLMLGTLVENAVRHGLAPFPGVGRLALKAHVAGAHVEIVVSDNGVGLKDEAGVGIGLANLTARLRLLYGGHASFRLVGIAPHGCAAILRLPYEPTRT